MIDILVIDGLVVIIPVLVVLVAVVRALSRDTGWSDPADAASRRILEHLRLQQERVDAQLERRSLQSDAKTLRDHLTMLQEYWQAEESQAEHTEHYKRCFASTTDRAMALRGTRGYWANPDLMAQVDQLKRDAMACEMEARELQRTGPGGED